MIGGVDVQIPTSGNDASLEVAVRAIRQRWTKAVFENALTGERYRDFSEIPFGEIDEIFIYKDPDAAAVWETEGAVPAACNTMIHLLSDRGLITIVVDSRDQKIEELIQAILSALRDEIQYALAEAA